jgi:hypothetical protein
MSSPILTKSSRSLSLSRSLAITLGLTLGLNIIGTSNGRAEETRLTEPYNPKPSGECPTGWEIQILEGSQIDNSTTLNNKRVVKVTVPAYELVPSKPKDGSVMTTLRDPGFDPKLANAQKDTVGATLTSYSEQAGVLSEKLSKIVESLRKDLGDVSPTGASTPSQHSKAQSTPVAQQEIPSQSPVTSTPNPSVKKPVDVLTNDNTEAVTVKPKTEGSKPTPSYKSRHSKQNTPPTASTATGKPISSFFFLKPAPRA